MKILKIKNLIILIICLTIIYCIWLLIVPAKNIYAAGNDIPQLIKNINRDIDKNDFISVNKEVYELQDRAETIQANLKFFKFVKMVPYTKEKYNQVNNSLTDIIVICENLNPIIESSLYNEQISKNDILISFLNNPEAFQKISESFDNLSNNISMLSSWLKIENYSGISDIKLIAKILKISQPISKNLLELAGRQRDKRYLILLQNNTELRPTGGFIGTYGIATISDGKLKNIFIDDIYHLDSQSIGKLNNQMPDPIRKYIQTEEWYMRDCNWQVDFPSAMIDCLNIYNLEKNNLDAENPDNRGIYENNLGNIDGIIAINPDIAGKLLEIVGTQEISGILFEGKNFTDDLQKAVELYYKERGVSHWDRKNIIADLAKNILKDLKNIEKYDYEKIIDLIVSGLETKDVLLYSTNPEIQNNFVSAGWAGEVRQFDNDYLMIVDSNLASFKSDQFIKRTINYSLEKTDNNELIATLKINYKHDGGFSWNSTRYRTYTRILVPSGSKFIESNGAMIDEKTNNSEAIDKYEIYGKMIYGLFTVTEPKQEKDIIVKYKLPQYIADQINKKDYKLLIQKQPGVKNAQFIINANFKEDFRNVKINIPNIINSNLSSISAKQDLNKDQIIQINW